MRKQPYTERPDGASLAFFRRLNTPIDRLDRFEDCCDICIFRPEDDLDQQIALITERWQWRKDLGALALAYPADLRALMLLARWYHGLDKSGRHVASSEIRREIYAMPELTDPFGEPVAPAARVARDEARRSAEIRKLRGDGVPNYLAQANGERGHDDASGAIRPPRN